MKENEELILIDKYSNLFSSSFYGFEVPSGWDWVVKKYLEKTQWDVENNCLELKIAQIKEKFGRLRIYTYVENNEEFDSSNIAYCEALADYTCEDCGVMTKDKIYTSDWIRGLCPKCFEERKNETT